MSTKSFALTGVSAALLSLSLSPVAFAADEKTETVYVSATRSEGPQMPVATQITLIDSEQIRLSGATTIAEVLRTQAGIQIQDADGSGGRNVTVAMRGFSSTAANNTLILVDGRKLNNPSLAGPALNTIALKDIERVEIIQGSAGVLYGDQAVGGVINVITHKAKAGTLKGSITAEKGTARLENYAANVNQGFANGLNYSISAQKRNADNFRDNNQSAATNVLGNIGFDFARGKVFVEQQRIEDDLRLAGPLPASDAAINPRQTFYPKDFANQDTDLTRVGGQIELVKDWQLLAEYADRDEESYGFNTFTHDFVQTMRVKNASPRVVGNIATGHGTSTVTLGYDNTRSTYEATTYTRPDYEQTVDGYYGQVIYPVTEQVSVTAGARHSNVEDKNNKNNKRRSENLNAYELGVNYQINSAWKVFARGADGFRFANADENGLILSSIDFLEAQTSKSQEAGVAWAEKTASVSYSLYHMNVENEITFDSGSYLNINLPKSERQGFLFDGNIQLSEQISLRGNYTYTDASLASGSLKGKEVPFVARDSANIGIVFNFVKNLSLAFDSNYVGSRYQLDDEQNASEKAAAVTLFNVNLLWDIKNIEVGFRVKNITSEKYSDYQSIYYQYPQPGRTYSAHIGYNF